MSMFLVTMVFIFLISSSMETNEQKDTQLDEKDTELLIEDTELDSLSATRQRIRARTIIKE